MGWFRCLKHLFSSTSDRTIKEQSCASNDPVRLETIVQHVDCAKQGLSVKTVVDWRRHHRVKVRFRILAADPAHVADRKLDNLSHLVRDVSHFLAIKVTSLEPEVFNLDAGVTRDLIRFEG